MNAPARIFDETRVVPGFPSYAVSASGRVGRIGTSTWLRQSPAKRGGYLVVSLWEKGKGRTKPVHQLVTLAFHGPRPSPSHDAAHGDGDKLHNHETNLRWATKAENEADKIRHGRSNRGERNGQAKLTDAQAREIIALVAGGARQHVVAAQFGITQGAVSNIVNGKRRCHE